MALGRLAVAAAVGISALAATAASAFELEGVYNISQRDACEGDHVDTVILLADADGALRAAFSSYEYGLVYHLHDLAWAGGADLAGSTVEQSNRDAVFEGTISADHQTIRGTVDDASCPASWTFTAEKVALPTYAALSPARSIQTTADFVGSYETATNTTQGVLRLIDLGDGRVTGNFGNDLVPRIARFERARLDTPASRLELFSYDDDEARIKWTFDYGLRDGRLTLQGYGLSVNGRFYPVSASHL